MKTIIQEFITKLENEFNATNETETQIFYKDFRGGGRIPVGDLYLLYQRGVILDGCMAVMPTMSPKNFLVPLIRVILKYADSIEDLKTLEGCESLMKKNGLQSHEEWDELQNKIAKLREERKATIIRLRYIEVYNMMRGIR